MMSVSDNDVTNGVGNGVGEIAMMSGKQKWCRVTPFLTSSIQETLILSCQ